MGCCVSTNGYLRKDKNFQLGSDASLKPKSTNENRAPPPSIEEETVKEVLSETPKPKPLLPQPIKNAKQENKETDKKKIHIEPRFLGDKIKTTEFKNGFLFPEEEISEKEISDICSLTLSETVSTTTFNNEKRDEDDDGDGEEVKQRVKRSPVSKLPLKNRAVSGDFVPKKDWVFGKSPARKTEQSPDKRNNTGRGIGGGSVRLVHRRESCTYQAGREGLRPDPKRRDPGESSGRRSRSPATNRSIMGRSPSARRANGSPSRVRTDIPESGRSGKEGKWPSTSNTSSNDNNTTKESLENPFVSLECFIFL